MKLDHLFELLSDSNGEDWATLHPVDLKDLGRSHDPADSILRHSHRAVLTTSVEISVEWGLPEDEGRPVEGVWASWSTFPDRSVYSIFGELLYFGNVVHRQKLVLADDARVILPAPLPVALPGRNPKIEKWEVQQSDVTLPRLLNLLQGQSRDNFDHDMLVAGFAIAPAQ